MPKKLTTDGLWKDLEPFEALSEGGDSDELALGAVRILLNRFAEVLKEDTNDVEPVDEA